MSKFPFKGNRTWHGLSHTTEYQTYRAMLLRCSNPNVKSYPSYGGRGIKVYETWQGVDGFANFLDDMGNKPDPSYTLERKDNDGDYEPSNCIWATRTDQVRNRRVRADNKTGYTGIHWDKNRKRWMANIKVNYKNITLGRYKDKNDAIAARKSAEEKYFV